MPLPSIEKCSKNKDGETFGYYLECGEMSFIEIFDQKLKCKQWGGVPVELKPGTQVNHLCLEVTDLKAFVETLTSRGVKVGNYKVGCDDSIQAWTADPDGNTIEFMQYTGKSWQLRGNEPNAG
jgi:lactoylglutathione lyase